MVFEIAPREPFRSLSSRVSSGKLGILMVEIRFNGLEVGVEIELPAMGGDANASGIIGLEVDSTLAWGSFFRRKGFFDIGSFVLTIGIKGTDPAMVFLLLSILASTSIPSAPLLFKWPSVPTCPFARCFPLVPVFSLHPSSSRTPQGGGSLNSINCSSPRRVGADRFGRGAKSFRRP